MSKATKLVIAIAIVAVIAVGALVLKNKSNSSSSNTSPSSSTSSSSSSDTATAALVITYDGSGFSLSTNTIKAGQTVKVVNSSSSTDLQFDSDPHPVHTDNTELNIGAIAPGKSATFTVTKTGTWGFHNHLNPSQHSSFTVE